MKMTMDIHLQNSKKIQSDSIVVGVSDEEFEKEIVELKA